MSSARSSTRCPPLRVQMPPSAAHSMSATSFPLTRATGHTRDHSQHRKSSSATRRLCPASTRPTAANSKLHAVPADLLSHLPGHCAACTKSEQGYPTTTVSQHVSCCVCVSCSPCSEGLLWHVLSSPIKISQSLLNK